MKFGLSVSALVVAPLAALAVSFAGRGGAYPPTLPKGEACAPPTQEQKMWALATCAILTESNHGHHELLGGCERTPAAVKDWQDGLARWWNTHNRNELLDTLMWIEEGGHRREFDDMARDLTNAAPARLAVIRDRVRVNPDVSNKVEIVVKCGREFGRKSIAAWDYDRYVAVCGWGYIAGYMTEDEAWQHIMPAARLLQATFSSWEELGKNHIAGREFWSLRQTQKAGERTRQSYQKLLKDPSSPWVRIPWNLDLTPPRAAK